jgi:hypothetical protein
LAKISAGGFGRRLFWACIGAIPLFFVRKIGRCRSLSGGKVGGWTWFRSGAWEGIDHGGGSPGAYDTGELFQPCDSVCWGGFLFKPGKTFELFSGKFFPDFFSLPEIFLKKNLPGILLEYPGFGS